MALQLGAAAAGGSWSAQAIHDTVAAIMRQSAYRRSLRASLMQRLFEWLGDWWSRLARAVTHTPHGRAIAIALAVFVVALVVARLVYAARLRETRAASLRPSRKRGELTVAPWDDAQRLAAEGRYAEAAHALYRGVLQLLATRERLRLHPSKTSGEYARELRARSSPLYAPFRQFGRRYDRALFGTGVFDADTYEQLRRDAQATLDAGRAA